MSTGSSHPIECGPTGERSAPRRIRSATMDLIRQRLVLAEDADAILERRSVTGTSPCGKRSPSPRVVKDSGLWLRHQPAFAGRPSTAIGCVAETPGTDLNAQLPPTFRGVRMRGMKPREVVAFQGWCVSGFGARAGAAAAASGASAVSWTAASARAADAWAASFSRQQCLYLRPEPQ